MKLLNKMTKPIIAMTGGSGFIGQHMISALLSSGYTVRVLVRTKRKIEHLKHPKLEILEGNLTDNGSALVSGSDVLLSFAGAVKGRSFSELMKINCHFNSTLASIANKEGVNRLVLLSSQVACQPHLSSYAISKLHGENAVKENFANKIAIIRAPAVFGPGDLATKPFFDFIEKGILPVAGGRNWRNRKTAMVFVSDLVKDVIDNAITGNYDDKIVTPSTIKGVSWEDFANYSRLALGKKIKIFPIPLSVLWLFAVMNSLSLRFFGIGHLSIGKLREFLYVDWSSEDIIKNPTPFTEALRITSSYYQKEKNV
jgi:nucleoside-diphosphate-sugar epimerase